MDWPWMRLLANMATNTPLLVRDGVAQTWARRAENPPLLEFAVALSHQNTLTYIRIAKTKRGRHEQIVAYVET